MREELNFPAQKEITKLSMIAVLVVSGIIFLSGHSDVATGIIFGCLLIYLNYLALGFCPRVYLRFSSPYLAKAVAFIYYNARFWLIVLILYLTVPRFGFGFGVGCFIGFLIPKIAVGILVLTNRSEDWWLRRSNTMDTNQLAGLETVNEFLNVDPFEIDAVEVEMKKYLDKKE